MSMLQEEVIRAQGSIITTEATCAKAIRVVLASVQEAAMAREGVKASIKEAKDQATLAERETQEKVLKTEAESAASLTPIHEEANEFARKVALLEGELADAR
jgi:translation initiation factor 2B subunit (eIF-2B alpha/beta/delta family)